MGSVAATAPAAGFAGSGGGRCPEGETKATRAAAGGGVWIGCGVDVCGVAGLFAPARRVAKAPCPKRASRETGAGGVADTGGGGWATATSGGMGVGCWDETGVGVCVCAWGLGALMFTASSETWFLTSTNCS
jgi:hypothetical protein